MNDQERKAMFAKLGMIDKRDFHVAKGDMVLQKFDTIHNKKGYSAHRFVNHHQNDVRDGIKEVLGRDSSKINSFMVRGKPNSFPMRIPIALMGEKKHEYFAEDSLASSYEREAYKGKLRHEKISPQKFLNLAGKDSLSSVGSRKTIESIKEAIRDGKPIETPFLEVDPETGKILGHEGRHRSQASVEVGLKEIPITIRSPKPIRSMTPEEKKTFFDVSSFKKQTSNW